MKTKILFSYLVFLFFCFIGFGNLYSQSISEGTLIGRITGSEDKKALPFATVMVAGTNNGVAADVDGNYILRNINAGKRTIIVSYIGYKTKKIDVAIKPDMINKLNVALEITAIKGKEVVVSAQRVGQQGAINEQINSNTIENVVSADRLQENPDANSAEAIGRLPGISLIRSGGEGTGIVIRGLDPKYSQVLLDGIALPSTDDNTRSTSVAGISQYILQGVEVFKSITPDMEGDAVAGTINLKLGEAPSGLKYSLMAQGGYNHLNDYLKNYKLVGDISNRFFNDNLGVMLSLDAESVNRSDQTLSASYDITSASSPGQLAPLYVNTISLNDETRINGRSSGSLLIDYRLSPTTKLFFNNFFSHTDQNYSNVAKSYLVNSGTISYSISDVPNIESELYLGSLKAEHQFRFFKLDEGLVFSQSHAYTPDSRYWIFNSVNTMLKKFGDQATESLPLNEILAGATDTLSKANLNNFEMTIMGRSADDMVEKHINAYINLKAPFEFGKFISGYIKFGAEYKVNNRNRVYDSRQQIVWGPMNPAFADSATTNLPWVGVASTKSLSMQGLYDYTVNNFMKGQYNFGWYPNISRLNQIFDWWNSYSNYYIYNVNPKDMPPAFSNGQKIGFQPNWPAISPNRQRLNEFYYAGYLMGELDLGDMISFVPGVRYEKVRDNLGGWWAEVISQTDPYHPYNAPGYSTDSTHNDEYWLPMIHLKIKPTDWFQTLLSFTQTLSRPDYNMLIPYVILNRGMGTQYYTAGNPDLKPEFWTNYDLQFAVFSDKIGLVSVSGFYKKVKDKIWNSSIYRTPGQPWTFGAGQYFSDYSTVLITVPQNFNFPVYLKGLEFEAQTNLWYLPEPFNYITLDVNFTLINSETKYQYPKTSEVLTGYDNHGRPIYKLVSVDSIYAGPMLNQPKSIANFSFGYNYKGFNLWLSYQYTGAMVTSEPNLTEFQNDVSQFSRWDLQITQKLPIEGLEALFNYANINDPITYQNNLADPRPSSLESYGWTMDLGIRYRL
ncbi:MAG: TonB-dependent receptor [Ignavibacteriaceae bacterium]